LQESTSGLEQQVSAAEPNNLERLKKSGQFRKLTQNIKDLQRFFKAPFLVHNLLVDLSSIKPEGLTFLNIDFSESVIQVKKGKKTELQVVFEINISGAVKDLQVLTQFKRVLEDFDKLNPSGYGVTITEDVEQRNSDTGIIPFELLIVLKPTN